MFDDIKLKMGYSEMYEFAEQPSKVADVLGRFIQFSEKTPGKIEIATKPDKVIGVSTIGSAYTSDNMDHWWAKNVFNEIGDMYIQEKIVAVGKRVYNSKIEKSYITTTAHKIHVPLQNPKFNEELKYVERTDRLEWIRVNLLGKVIIYDNGELQGGDYCKPYDGEDKNLIGTAVKATDEDVKNPSVNTYYVISRVSKNTVIILFK